MDLSGQVPGLVGREAEQKVAINHDHPSPLFGYLPTCPLMLICPLHLHALLQPAAAHLACVTFLQSARAGG